MYTGARNNLQFTGEDFFADKDVCSIVLEVPNSALGTEAAWAMGSHAGSALAASWVQAIAARCPRRLSSLPATKEMPISLANRRTMPVSSPCSRTRWNIRADIRRRKRGGSQGHYCRRSCPTIRPGRASFPGNGRAFTDDVVDAFSGDPHKREGNEGWGGAPRRSARRVPLYGAAPQCPLTLPNLPQHPRC